MARIQPIDTQKCAPAIKTILRRHVQDFGGHVESTQACLAHSIPAFESYAGYCNLYREALKLLGAEDLLFYSYQISLATESPVVAARFKKSLLEMGIDTDKKNTDERLRQLCFFGTCMVKNKGRIADHVYHRIEVFFSDEQMILLIAYTGQLMALNVFDNVIETEPHLSAYLQNTL